ncbi:type I restriction endonuclease [Demequina sp.]|uniref:type I restriction endonuclease n=1 Tax=Demequina sp. TaxID=2050685 RepID=UPI0025BDD1A4|nr:type I restriction endonuclease [Demequina sp.]
MNGVNEARVERAALEWLKDAGWTTVSGESIAPGEPAAERAEFTQTTLDARLRGALARLNPDLPASAIDDAHKRLLRTEGPDLVTRNRATHRQLVNGVTVEYRAPGGQIRGAQVRVIDFDHPGNNDHLAVNQFTVVEGKVNRRPDVVLFVNGLPPAMASTAAPRLARCDVGATR